MAKQSNHLAVLTSALALTLSCAASAGDLATAKMLADTCAGCHGTNGASVGPASPTIGGMEAVVFTDTMNAFKAEDEDDRIDSTIMGRIAKGYSDEEIELMAAFFAEQPYVPAKQDFDKDLVEKGAKLHDKYCEKCHAEGGKQLPGEEYQLLAGQWTPYMQYAMEDFREGHRPMPKKMKSKLDQMLAREGDKGLDALYAYYASQQ